MQIVFFVVITAIAVITAIIWLNRKIYMFIKNNNETKNWKNTIRKYLEKYAKEYADENNVNVVVPDNYLQILENYCDKVRNIEVNGEYYELEYGAGRGLNPNSLNGDAGTRKNWSIIVTPRWAAKLIFEQGDHEVINAFEITLGHELSHKEDVDAKICGILCWRLFKTLNEVRADFGSAKKMKNCNRDKLVEACKYKKNFKKKDRWGLWHPSWEKRSEYASNFDFNDRLIRQVAQDIPFGFISRSGYCVERAIEIYRDKHIILEPPIKSS